MHEYDPNRVISRTRFNSEEPAEPGVLLFDGILPRMPRAGLALVHVGKAEADGTIVPSFEEDIDPVTGRVKAPGDVVVVDINVDPPEVLRTVGHFVVQDTGDVAYVPESGITVSKPRR